MMVISPNVPNLPYTLQDGVKHFELFAEPVKQEILPEVFLQAWGYNGTTPGPTILVYPGDWVNIRVYNRLPVPTSVHWHGLNIPNAMDGVPEVEPSPRIEPGYYFDYHFQIMNPPGTHMYHAHYQTVRQEMMGLSGGLIILDPIDSHTGPDYFMMLHEFHANGLDKGIVRPGSYSLDPISDMFNFFTINGRCYPFTTPLPVAGGDRIKLRLANAGMNAHPMHLHGHQFVISASDGNTIALSNRLTKNTIPVASGETFDIEFIANNPGIWPFHCHIPHHVANNFTDPTGGMFTTVIYKR